VIKEPKFERCIVALNGHIYDFLYKQADAFAKNIREIAGYISTTFKYGNDAKLAVEFMKTPTFIVPADIDETKVTKAELRIWEKEIDEYMKRKSFLQRT
jgi:FKBP-type peptidyl-prolyl cis-trans isomerase (trigger factor)